MAEKDVEQILAAAEQVVKLRDAVGRTWSAVLKIFEDHLDSLSASSSDLKSKALFSSGSPEVFVQDSAAQRKRLKEHARAIAAAPEKFLPILQRILEKGVEYSSGETYRYSPEVLAASKAEIKALLKTAQSVFQPMGKG